MDAKTTAPPSAFRREVVDKIGVAYHVNGSGRAHTDIVLRQCEDVLVEQHESELHEVERRALREGFDAALAALGVSTDPAFGAWRARVWADFMTARAKGTPT